MNRVILAGLVLCAAALPCAAQPRAISSDSGFSWSGRVPAGAWLRIHDHRGSVRVVATDGDVAEVRAEVSDRARDGDRITFELVNDGNDVVICAYPAGAGSCNEDGVRIDDRDYDRRRLWADFTVRLPRGVKIHAGSGNGDVMVTGAGAQVVARSGNGDVQVTGAAGQVEASSGNGAVDVDDVQGPVEASSGNGRVRVTTARGPVNASSGNGAIEVRMTSLEGDSDMEFHTGNGSVTVTVPPNFEGELDSNTGNGRVVTDFPITVSGRLQPNRLRGTIGRGGRRIRMTSGNGSVELRKGG
ncbi:MAG TPA: DUF4097 family beta strand repeat-containing protein [Gemmatimonadaceae bacterium]|nr:DUF4097 family beta strand repeat-containing protein [Gemmatimonadaceae bacterium]